MMEFAGNTSYYENDFNGKSLGLYSADTRNRAWPRAILILRGSGQLILPAPSILSVFAALLMLTGAGVLGHCIYEFAFRGNGTLSPNDAPKTLVVHGLYRYTRNPMYVAILLILLSEAILFGSKSIFIYFCITILMIHLFVLLYEEPHLRGLFGKEYEGYCRAVPRWWIARQPYAVNPHNT